MASIQQVRESFQSYNGYTEEPLGSNNTIFGRWYGINPAAWCAMFISFVLYHLGIKVPASTEKGFAWTPSGANYFKKQGRWISQTEARGKIREGMLVFYYWSSLGRIGHVEWVDQVLSDDTFYAWGGNTDVRGGRSGGKVIRQLRSLATVGSPGGFGIIEYDDQPAPSPTPPTPTPPPPSTDWTEEMIMALPTLRRGSTGQHVRNLQGLLIANGRPTGTDGDFGPDTERKLKDWQAAAGVQGGADGICGKYTWRGLIGA